LFILLRFSTLIEGAFELYGMKERRNLYMYGGMEENDKRASAYACARQNPCMCDEEVSFIRKSRYVMTFPVKDEYLLINGLSGAVRLVSKESAQKFFDGEITEDLKPFFTHMTLEEEKKRAQYLCEFLMENAAQCADSTLAVTYDCNLRCPYCYEIWVKRPETMKMVINERTVDKAFKALEFLNKDCSEKKPLSLTGGEPLMRKNEDIVKYILRKGTDLGYSFIVFTNGVELNHFLSDLSSVDVQYLQITLDGPRHLHDKRRIFRKGQGTFDAIVKNIEKAKEMELRVLIRTNTDAEILSCMDEMAHFFREKGWATDSNIRFSLASTCDQHIDPSTIEEQTKTYEKIMEIIKSPELNFFDAHLVGKLQSLFGEHPKFWPAFWNCNAVTKRYALDPFGDVYPCWSMMGWKEGRIGVYIPELSFNENYEKWRGRTLFAMDGCTECEIALVCGGGCGYASFLNEGDLFKPVCTTTERIVVRYLEHLYERRNVYEFAQSET
jgi:uncharacterized protein